MKKYIGLVLVIFTIWPAGSVGQELIWQASLDGGVVHVTENSIGPGHYSEFHPTGFPAKLVEWDNGYVNYFFSIKNSGEIEPFSVANGRHPVSICDPSTGKWYFGKGPNTTVVSRPRVVWLQNGPYMNQGWPIGPNRYVLISENQTFLFNRITSESVLLDPKLRLGWPAWSSSGVVAVRGHLTDLKEVLKVFGPSGQMVFQQIEASTQKSIDYLAVDNDGTFVEFSIGEKNEFKELDYDHRYRVFLGSGAKKRIPVPMPGGRLRWQSNNIAVWEKGNDIRVVRLDDQDRWQPVEEYLGMPYYFQALENDGFLLALQQDEGGVSLSFYDSEGKEVSGPFFLGNVLEATLHEGGLLVVNSINKTSILEMNN